MNKRLKKLLKRTGIVTTGIVAFGGAVIGGYIVTPNRSKLIDVTVQEREKTLFERFVEKLTKDVGMSEPEEGEDNTPHYIKASFAGLNSGEKFNITYKKDKESTFVNTVSINEGEIDLRLTDLSLSGIEFNVDLDVNYNGKNLPVTLGHFKDDIYFRLKDMKIKFTDFNAEGLSEKYWFAFMAYANLDSKALFSDLGALISGKVGSLMDDLMSGNISLGKSEATDNEKSESEESGFDFSSLLSTAPKQSKRGDYTVFSLGETEKVGGLMINLVADKDLSLKRVELENLNFGTLSINGAIDVEVAPYNDFHSPIETDDSYVEVFNYTSLTGKILSLFKEGNQKVGLEFGLDLDHEAEVKDEETKETSIKTTKIGKVRGSINVDFDKLLDLRQYAFSDKEENLPDNIQIVGDLKDLGFNLQLKLLGQNDIEYGNLDFAFANGEGYLRFNQYINENNEDDAVIRLHFDTNTTNWILTKLPELIDNLSEDENTDSMETLSKFLTDELVTAIENYDFSFILEMIETLKNSKEGFELGINLSKLGLGEDASVSIKVDNDPDYFSDYFDLKAEIEALNSIPEDQRTPEQEALLDEKIALFAEKMAGTNESGLYLDVNNIAFGNFKLNAKINTAPFKNASLGDTGVYQSTKFIPDVVDQVCNYIDTKKTGFKITGDMLDGDNLGITFEGRGRLDNNDEVKEGYGNMTIKQYKYHANQVWATHELAVNVTNLKSNVHDVVENNKVVGKSNDNLALFMYGNPNGDNIKGKLKLQTFTDIFNIIKTFIGEEGSNPKYTKFLAPITKVLGMNSLGTIIENRDYLQLVSPTILKKIDFVESIEGTEIKIIVNKNMFGMELPEDISISIFTKYNSNNKQELHSLVIHDLQLSNKENASKLNLTFELEDYENGTVNLIAKNNTANYMDLNGIKTLLDFGINTTKVNFYHLTANANVDLNESDALSVALSGINFYIYVDGVKVKVFGTFDSIPKFFLFTEHYKLKDMKAMFSFETYDSSEDDKVGGIFNIKRYYAWDDTERKSVGFLRWETHYYHYQDSYIYRCDSKTFMDNIAQYLITGLIGIRHSLYASALNTEKESSSGDEKPAGNFVNAFTSTGFQAYKNDSNEDVIKLGLNLNELTGINALKELEATITSQHINYEGSNKGMDIIKSLDASLRINFASIFNINVTLYAEVADAAVPHDEALSKWNAAAESEFHKLVSIDYPQANFNNPDNPYHSETKEEYWPN